MRRAGLQAIRYGQVVSTTATREKTQCPLNYAQLHFHAESPNQLRVSDSTYASTSQDWLYVALVIDHHQQLLSSIGYITPVGAEAKFH